MIFIHSLRCVRMHIVENLTYRNEVAVVMCDLLLAIREIEGSAVG